MAIKPTQVKELRERTGAGMMDCKRALEQSQGDIDTAAELLRKAGQAKADKKASRIAAEGKIVISSDPSGTRHAIVEINSETDFVAKDENFAAFVDIVGTTAVAEAPLDVAGLMAATVDGESLEELRTALVAKVGENIAVRRFALLEGGKNVGTYSHMGKIGVLVELDGGDDTLAKDIAMHVAASAPAYVDVDDVPAADRAKEREIFEAQALAQGKPANIVEKIVEGQLRKHFDNLTLTGQAFVKDPDQRVRDLLKAAGATVQRFIRFEVGEGIEKKADDFVGEVMAQASRSS
jgi:elongation factor Ts